MTGDRNFEIGSQGTRGSVTKNDYDYRGYSVATSGYSKEQDSENEYAQQGGPHIGIGMFLCQCESTLLIAMQRTNNIRPVHSTLEKRLHFGRNWALDQMKRFR